jgi:hypothetical protein
MGPLQSTLKLETALSDAGKEMDEFAAHHIASYRDEVCLICSGIF